MLKKLLIVWLALAAVSSSRAEIDLTPFPVDFNKDGFAFRQLLFNAGAKRVTYDLPLKWTYHASPTRLLLMPPDKLFAEAAIEVAPLARDAQPIPADGMVQQAVAGLPAGAQAVEVEMQEENSFPLNGNASFEVVVGYQTLGEKFQRSVVFITMGGDRYVFRLSAKRSDFDALNRTFRRSLATWRETAAAAASLQD